MFYGEEMAKIVRDLFDVMYGGWTDEDLLMRPQELRHFTSVVNTKVGRNLNSNAICKFLMGARKDGDNPFGKKRVNYTPILELELKASEVKLSVDEFEEVVAKVFLRDNPPSEAERLQRDCDRAMEFCRSVRQAIGFVESILITDTMILRALTRSRKAGRFRESTNSTDVRSSGEA